MHHLFNRRSFLKTSSLAAVGTTLPAPSIASRSRAIPKVQRLSWAGLKIELDGTTLLIDPIVTDIWQGNRNFPIVTPEITTRRCHVLLTHLHNDHYDRAAITAVVGERGRVVCHEAIASDVASDGFRIRSATYYEPIQLGGFLVSAVPAVDGLGVTGGQVSWVIRTDDQTLFHGGDTLWHGHWWLFRKQFGPFDAAYLPINGFQLKGMNPPSGIPASLTPEQAVAAGTLLDARVVTPIHYGVNDPEYYIEVPEAANTFMRLAAERNLGTAILEPSDWAE